MCGSQYSSLLKRSENIKDKFENSLDCLCMRVTSAPWSVAQKCVISAPHITAPTPRVHFYKKLQKGHICEILSRKGLNCKKDKGRHEPRACLLRTLGKLPGASMILGRPISVVWCWMMLPGRWVVWRVATKQAPNPDVGSSSGETVPNRCCCCDRGS